MSRSETGVMASRGDFNNIGLQKNQMSPQPVIQNMRLAFSPDGNTVYKPISPTSPTYQSPNGVTGSGGVGSEVPAPGGGDSGSGINMNVAGVGGELPVKKKRGRPRKYGPESALPLALAPQAPPPASGGFSSPTSGGGASGGPSSPPSHKKSRGRPPGSSNKKHQLPSQPIGSYGSGFVPHVITVKAGEDVSSKIMSFLQHGSRALCILSANGAISNVTLRQAATSGGTVTYEGRFEILSLSGSFLLSEVGGQRSRTGGLSVSLSGPDGRVLGGGVAGLLTAASPVQVIVGSFNADGGSRSKEPKPAPNQTDPVYTPSRVSSGGGGIGASSPPWDGTMSESSGGAGSPLNHHGSGHGNNSGPQGMSGMPWK